MNKILFVDDEARVLDGLRRMLHGTRGNWEIQQVTSGEAALKILDTEDIDVLVADIRMPGMSGTELLDIVKRNHPDVVRLILSGHAEKSAVMSAFGVAQQYLVKPCDKETLLVSIQRALMLRERLHNADLRSAMGGMNNLPVLPAIFRELVACLRSPDASVKEVGQIISQDIAMVTAILKIINSAYFGFPQPIGKIDRAVALLGLDAIMALVLQNGLFANVNELDVVPGYDPVRLQRHSLDAANNARRIAAQAEATLDLRDEAFLAGIVHDVGELALLACKPDKVRDILKYAGQAGVSLETAERHVVQATHSEIGAYVLSLWGFPDQIVETVLLHHHPGGGVEQSWGLAGIVHLADAIAEHPQAARLDDLGSDVDYEYLRRFRSDEEMLAWMANIKKTDNQAVAS